MDSSLPIFYIDRKVKLSLGQEMVYKLFIISVFLLLPFNGFNLESEG